MNAVDALPASGLALFFVLGLRHGVEPDHIAAIDGMTIGRRGLARCCDCIADKR